MPPKKREVIKIENWKKNKIAYNQEYTKTTYQRFTFLVKKEDTKKIDFIKSQKSISSYINNLIDNDIQKSII